MLISFKNNVINTDHITTAELCVGGPGDSLSDTELYIFFTGDTQLAFEGVEAIGLWGYLKEHAVPVPEVELPAGTISPPDRPWLEEQIEELGQHISETGLTA